MAFGKLPVVLQQEVAQRDLDLVGSKESSGAGMLPMPKAEVMLTCADQVCYLVLSRVVPHAQKTVAVKLLGIIVVLCILHVGARD